MMSINNKVSPNLHPKLNTKVTRCSGVLTLYEGDTKDKFKETFLHLLNSWDMVREYYFIFHDADLKETGDEKLVHIHFIINFTGQIRLQTILNKISVFFGLESNRIGVQKLVDMCACLRYFLHMEEDESKKRYDINEIISSENLETIMHYIYSDEDSTLSEKRLFALVMYYSNEIDLMYHIGLPLYHKYRYEIKSLYENSMHLFNKYRHLYDELKTNLDKETDNLPF